MKKESPLLNAKKSVVVVIDLQTKILNAVEASDVLLRKAERIVEAASWLEIPVLYSEQNPKGLGPTHPDMANMLKKVPKLEKTSFSLFGVAKFREWTQKLKGKQVILLGVESHICILQTALDLVTHGECDVFAVADAMGSRSISNHKLALNRMESQGVNIVSLEMVLMEWLRGSGHKDFKVVQGLIK